MQRNKVKYILRLFKNDQLDIIRAEILLADAFFETDHTFGLAEKIKNNSVEMFL